MRSKGQNINTYVRLCDRYLEIITINKLQVIFNVDFLK